MAKIYIGTRTLLAKTCTKCCYFKSASDFPLAKTDGVYYVGTWCKKCMQKKTRRWQSRKNNTSRLTAHKAKDVWTEAEIKKLEEMTKAGKDAGAIALVLKRSRQAIYTKRCNLKRSES